MIEDLNITLKLLRDKKSKLFENIKNIEDTNKAKTIMNNIFEIDIKIKEYNFEIENKIKEYNEMIKNLSINNIDNSER